MYTVYLQKLNGFQTWLATRQGHLCSRLIVYLGVALLILGVVMYSLKKISNKKAGIILIAIGLLFDMTQEYTHRFTPKHFKEAIKTQLLMTNTIKLKAPKDIRHPYVIYLKASNDLTKGKTKLAKGRYNPNTGRLVFKPAQEAPLYGQEYLAVNRLIRRKRWQRDDAMLGTYKNHMILQNSVNKRRYIYLFNGASYHKLDLIEYQKLHEN